MEKFILVAMLSGLFSPIVVEANGSDNGHKHHNHSVGPKGDTGDQGPKGDKGDTGAPGANGIDGANGLNGKDASEKTKVILEGSVRLHDSRKWQVDLFDKYDLRGRRNHEIGARLSYKLGKSYEERRIEELEKLVERHLAFLEMKYNSRYLIAPEGK